MIAKPTVVRSCRALALAAIAVWALTRLSFAQPTNQVFVLNEGYDRTVGAELLVESTVALVVSDGIVLVTDPGMVSDQAKLVSALATHGIDPEDVNHVFITHLHPDHTANVGMFPNAKLVDAFSIYDRERWIEHDDDFVLAPGIRVLRTPGHTSWDASLLIENTIKGTIAITHAWWHSDMTPKVDPFADDQSALERSRERLLGEADWIIPGHGAAFRNPNAPSDKGRLHHPPHDLGDPF